MSDNNAPAPDDSHPQEALVNLTPHEVVIVAFGVTTIIRPSGVVARIDETVTDFGLTEFGSAQTIPVKALTRAAVTGLPAPAEGRAYIVSQHVAWALPDRADLLFPFGLVKEGGRVVGCSSLGRVNPGWEPCEYQPCQRPTKPTALGLDADVPLPVCAVHLRDAVEDL